MKKIYKLGMMLGIGLLSIISLVQAQDYPFWKPVNGTPNDNTTNKGIVNNGNAGDNPGGRFNPSLVNVDGELFLFGGQRYNATQNDIWKFDKLTNVWSKVTTSGTGPNTRQSQAALSYNKQLYIFGSGTFVNDLFVFNTVSSVWTGLRANTGVNAIETGGAETWTPGGRAVPATWQVNGVIYMFAGRFAANKNRNDFWKYDIATDRWTKIGGSVSGENIVGVYGTKGVADAANWPGARSAAVTWASGNKLYLFGGVTTANSQTLNDLWVFDIASGKWTWLNGANTENAFATYGTKNAYAAANTPGSVREAVGWTDPDGTFYLFGGNGFVASGTSGNLIDVWQFDPAQGTNGQWRWLKGTQATGSVGTYGTIDDIGDGSYSPTSRGAGSAASIGSKLYLGFGYAGTGGIGSYNDLWVMDLLITPQVLPVNFISFNAQADGNRAKLTWSTASEHNNAYFEVEKSTDGINFSLLSKVTAQGNSTATANYVAYDNNPAQTTYYRLSQVDNNGTKTTLGSAVVAFKLDKAIKVSTYPNPATTQVSLNITAYTGKVLVTVKDVNGKSLKQYAGNASQGQALIFDVSDLASGIYFFEVSGNNFKQTEKVIVK